MESLKSVNIASENGRKVYRFGMESLKSVNIANENGRRVYRFGKKITISANQKIKVLENLNLWFFKHFLFVYAFC